MSPPRFLLLCLLGAGLGCVQGAKMPQPLHVFRYPGALRLSEDGRTLFVVGTNFDLAWEAGVLQAIDLEALDAAIGPGDPEGAEPLHIETVPLRDAVTIDSFGGEIAAAPVEGGLRLFVPHRAAGTVSVVDANSAGALFCHGGDADDCRTSAVVLQTPAGEPLDDPFAAVAAGDAVYVATLSEQSVDPAVPEKGRQSHLVRIPVEAPEAAVAEGLGAIRLRDLRLGDDGRIVGAGPLRSASITTAALLRFEPQSFGAGLGREVFSLYGFVAATDARAVLPRPGGEIWTLVSNPAALVVSSSDGAPLDETDVVVATALPGSPSRVAAIEASSERTLAVVTSSASDSLCFVDVRRGEVVGLLDGSGCTDPREPCPSASRRDGRRDPATDVGRQPFDLVVTPRVEGGYRIWVGGFGEATLRVVDLVDPARPWDARVVAVVGTPEAPEDG
ncbi:MAG: hypothetical protein D6729_13510 [Deltaproteobacteria bacterium]|nr:MAG: hypothetical protein D6729_13510 [Deltaproteobacteria bacterium]